METSPAEMEAEPPERDVPEVIIPPPAPIPTVVTQLVMFGRPPGVVQPRKLSRKSTIAPTPSDQLALFQN